MGHQHRKPKGSPYGGQYDHSSYGRADGTLTDTLDGWDDTDEHRLSPQAQQLVDEYAHLVGYVDQNVGTPGKPLTEPLAPRDQIAPTSAAGSPGADARPIIQIPDTFWTEHQGSAYDRANHEAIAHDFHGTVGVMDSGLGDGGSLYIDPEHPDAKETLDQLINGEGGLGDGIYDDTAYDELSARLVDEAWDDYKERDVEVAVHAHIAHSYGLAEDDVDDIIDNAVGPYGSDEPGTLKQAYMDTCAAKGRYPEPESAIDVEWPDDNEIVPAVADRVAADHMPLPTAHRIAATVADQANPDAMQFVQSGTATPQAVQGWKHQADLDEQRLAPSAARSSRLVADVLERETAARTQYRVGST